MTEALQYLASLPDEQARLDAIAEDLKNGRKRFDFAPDYGDEDWGGLRDIFYGELDWNAATKVEGYTSRRDITYFFDENDWDENQYWFDFLIKKNPSALTIVEINAIQKLLSEKSDWGLFKELISQNLIDLITINATQDNGDDNDGTLTYYSFRASDGTELKFTTFAVGGGIGDPGEISLCSTPYRTIYVPAENDYLLVWTDYLNGM